jgi:hypothetical protein
MDPISIIFAFAMKNPEMAASIAKSTTKPAVVDASKLQMSFADMSKEILKCYHKSARYDVADVVQAPWSRQSQYAAEKSAVVKISFSGMSGSRYEMYVAVMKQGEKFRTAVIQENTVIPYSKKCSFEEWTEAS